MIFVMYSASSPAVMEPVSATVTAYFSCKRVMTYRLFRPAFFQDAIKFQHEAAGGDEDREKEILIERIQSIKEEKQVSLRPHATLPTPIHWPLHYRGSSC